MNALDSPVEVLALDYLSLGLLTVVNNVWTWVAVITAAVSVWRIRSSSPRYQFPSEVSLIKPAPAVSPSPVERLAVAREPAAPTPAKVETPRPSPSPWPCPFNSEGRTSGKFTFYYDRDQEVEEDANVGRNGDVDGEDETGERKSGRARDCWEATMAMRMGDHMGFYRYQDLTMLDGNVVRLWDGCRKRNPINASPRIMCGGCDW